MLLENFDLSLSAIRLMEGEKPSSIGSSGSKPVTPDDYRSTQNSKSLAYHTSPSPLSTGRISNQSSCSSNADRPRFTLSALTANSKKLLGQSSSTLTKKEGIQNKLKSTPVLSKESVSEQHSQHSQHSSSSYSINRPKSRQDDNNAAMTKTVDESTPLSLVLFHKKRIFAGSRSKV